MSVEFGMLHVRRGMLVAGLIAAKRYDEGIAVYREAIQYADNSADQFWNPELHRLQGELLLGSSAPQEEVMESLQKSLTLSRKHGSKLLELRSTVSLCRLWQTQGKLAEAHQLLASIYGWFTEGFDTVDLKEAKALLEELAVEIQ
ncbi:MAG: hypothetical protein AAF702_21640 [Chloroflexota bacterium]